MSIYIHSFTWNKQKKSISGNGVEFTCNLVWFILGLCVCILVSMRNFMACIHVWHRALRLFLYCFPDCKVARPKWIALAGNLSSNQEIQCENLCMCGVWWYTAWHSHEDVFVRSLHQAAVSTLRLRLLARGIGPSRSGPSSGWFLQEETRQKQKLPRSECIKDGS